MSFAYGQRQGLRISAIFKNEEWMVIGSGILFRLILALLFVASNLFICQFLYGFIYYYRSAMLWFTYSGMMLVLFAAGFVSGITSPLQKALKLLDLDN